MVNTRSRSTSRVLDRANPSDSSSNSSGSSGATIAYSLPSPRSTSSSSTMTENEHHQDRLGIARYGSSKNTMRAEAWVSIYEKHMSNKSDNERVDHMYRFLDGDAVNWFAEEVAIMSSTPAWATVKQQFINRFGSVMIRPIIQAQKRYLRKSETVEAYYTDKVYMMRQSGLNDLDSVAMLTEGMPHTYKLALISSKPSNVQDWLSIALQIQASLQRMNSFASNKLNVQIPATVSVHATSASSSKSKKDKKPPRPCRFCEAAGHNEWHWHNECPRRTEAKTASPDEMVAAMCANSSKN